MVFRRVRAVRARFLFIALLTVSPDATAADARPPNLLVIMTDDQGWWDLGSSGNPHLDTPNLDRFATESVRFSRYYAAPVCSPTRAGMMTGRYAFRTGLYNTRFGGDSVALSEVMLPQLLRPQGYRTGLFGKWHLGRYHGYQPNQRGFDEFLGHYHGHIEQYEFARQLVHNGQPVESRGYVTDLFTDAAIAFIEQARGTQRPFFCYLAYNAPHSPHQLDTSHANQPRGDAMIEKHLKRGLPLQQARIYAMVERIDENIGRLLKHLETSGLARDTVVLYMHDNGGVSRHWNGGLRGLKASVYEGGVRSPLFVRWPGQFPAGGVVRGQASHVDLLPTLCEIAGANVPADRTIDGRSLVPLLRAGAGERHHEFVYHTWNRFVPGADTNWGISDQRYKLVGAGANRQKAGPADWNLFDLETDPSEENNIAAAQPAKVKTLRAEFERWFADVTRGIKFQPVPIPVGHAGENPVELQPSWAKTKGDTVKYMFEAYDWDTIEGWSKPGESVEWSIDVARAGRFEVAVDYGCAAANAGGRVKFACGDAAVTFTTKPTGSPNVFQRVVAGTIALSQGPATLRAEIVTAPKGEALRLNRVWLRRIDEAASR
ncbi:MAG: sulfatase-like hydrolase/transferase [Opitutaceae bacterium]